MAGFSVSAATIGGTRGPIAQWLEQRTHRKVTLARNRQMTTGRIQGNRSGSAGGNPEPSRRYTAGRCRDYLGAEAPLITG